MTRHRFLGIVSGLIMAVLVVVLYSTYAIDGVGSTFPGTAKLSGGVAPWSGAEVSRVHPLGDEVVEEQEEVGVIDDRRLGDAGPNRNKGEGVRVFQDLHLRPDDLQYYCDWTKLETIILDVDQDLEVANNAMNAMRGIPSLRFTTVMEYIIDSETYTDDHRCYAMQHLVWYVNNRGGSQSGWLMLSKYLDGQYPDSVRREACYGLIENPNCRSRARMWLEGIVGAGSDGDRFRDLLDRVAREYGKS